MSAFASGIPVGFMPYTCALYSIVSLTTAVYRVLVFLVEGPQFEAVM